MSKNACLCAKKLGLAMPKHTSTFPQDFPQLFSTRGPVLPRPPLKTAYETDQPGNSPAVVHWLHQCLVDNVVAIL